MPNIEAVIFDWGGTLSLFADIDMADMWRMAARHLAPEREDELCQRLISAEEQAWQRISVDQRAFKLAELLAAASTETGLDVAEAVLEEAAEHHLDSWTPHIVHDPDAVPTIAALRERGLRIGLLSNTHWPRHFHEHFLERDGLADLIDARCYTSDMRYCNPHPEAFQAAMAGVGAYKPSAIVFVGDRPYDDIWGAKSLGMKAVLRPNSLVPDYQVAPDAVIQALPELVGLVDQWS